MAYIPPEKAMMNLDINAPTSGGFESVGQSLLAQKRADTARADKTNKRNEKIMGALGLFSFGASAFRASTAKRAEELKARESFSIAHAKGRTESINTIASLNKITQKDGKYLSYEDIMNDRAKFEGVKTALRPLITKQMENTFNPQRYKELPASQVDLLESRATRNVLEDLLTLQEGKEKSKLQDVSDRLFGGSGLAGTELLQGSTTEEKLASGLNLTPEAFSGDTKRLYNEELSKLQAADSIFNIDNYLNGIARMDRGINIFKRRGDEDAVFGEGTAQMFLDSMKIQTEIIPIIQDSIVSNASQDYIGNVMANGRTEGTEENTAVQNIKLVTLKEDDIDNGTSKLGNYVRSLAMTNDMEEIIEEIDSDYFVASSGKVNEKTTKGQTLTNVAAAYSLRLNNPAEEEFAKELYMSSAHSQALEAGKEAGTDAYETFVKKRVEQFAKDMRKPAYAEQRSKFALLVALRAGAEERSFMDRSTDFYNNGYTFNPDRAMAMLSPALDFEEGVGYTQGPAFEFMNDTQRKNLMFLEVDEIQGNTRITQNEKEMLLQSLIDNIALTQFDSIDSFVKGYEEWIPVWKSQARHYNLYGQLQEDNANRAAQLQQRLFGNQIDKHIGFMISRGNKPNPFMEERTEVLDKETPDPTTLEGLTKLGVN